MTDHAIPPTQADFLDDDIAPMPRWPKVVGIISIVWGSIGLICNGLGLASSFLFAGMMKSAAEQMNGGMPPQITEINPMILLMYGVGLVWTILLIVAGAVTVARKPAGRPIHLFWSISNLLIAGWGIFLSVSMQNAIAQWVRDNPTADFSQNYSPMQGMVGLALGIVLGFAWPLFILVWFLFVKRSNADLAEGVEELAA